VTVTVPKVVPWPLQSGLPPSSKPRRVGVAERVIGAERVKVCSAAEPDRVHLQETPELGRVGAVAEIVKTKAGVVAPAMQIAVVADRRGGELVASGGIENPRASERIVGDALTIFARLIRDRMDVADMVLVREKAGEPVGAVQNQFVRASS
jgi:hypothetical protein